MSSVDDQSAPAGGRPELQPKERVIGAGIEWTARWSLRWVAIALGVVLLGLLVRETWPIVLPIVLALVLTSVLAPLAKFFRDRVRLPSGLSAAATLLSSLLIIIAIGFAIAPSVAGQTDDIVSDTTAGLQRLQDYVQDSDFVSKGQVDAALEGLQDQVKDSAGGIASGVLVGVSAVGSATVTLVITLILTFLFLKDGRRFVPWLRDLAGPRAGTHLAEVLTRAWATLGGFIRTQALVSLIDAVFIGAALLIVGVPLAVPLAILTFFGGFVPIVGAFVVGAVAVLVALVSNGLTGALIILAVILVVQQLEGNVLSPWLQSQSMNLHAAVVLLAVTLGSTLFGIIGAFLAVPTVAVAAVVLRYLNDIAASRSIDPGPSPSAEAEVGPDGEKEKEALDSGVPAPPVDGTPADPRKGRD
jgi:predicted PurR-regulated permease PerM